MQLEAAQKTLHSLCGGKGYQDGLRCVSHSEPAPHVKIDTYTRQSSSKRTHANLHVSWLALQHGMLALLQCESQAAHLYQYQGFVNPKEAVPVMFLV